METSEVLVQAQRQEVAKSLKSLRSGCLEDFSHMNLLYFPQIQIDF